MAKVDINGHSHQVVIEGSEDLEVVVKAAQKLWEDTLQPEKGPAGAAAGWAGDRRPSYGAYGFNLDVGSGSA